MYKIRGKVINVEEIDINTTKGDFVKKLVTIEELDSDFNHQHQFEIFGQENINVIEGSKKLREGELVNINFYIKSREYNGKFYNTLMIKGVIFENNEVSEDTPPF
jgi:hypothetical protein